MFGGTGFAELAEKDLRSFGVLSPDGPVMLMVVACGQRPESHMPIIGRSADAVPASFRQSAREGSVNQQ